MNGPVKVCFTCGRIYYMDSGHACTGRPAGASATGCDRALASAAFLPDGTPHPDLFLAERGWLAMRGVFRRPEGGGDGEDVAA